ncbi:cell division protein FtsL [Candidatus Oleimmundimicrobium sp.]|uniref:cell division protein FtsL n=1 Tax=Candidatus Oleimmundimicrobium sp. TaxID=3060597 RepID=UPI002724E7CC|nr:cell division protein FtsL [Candidatus Oleimmundimicrobium sp.]MDO8885502.1 cell division protein FtsL [Candidatus Oleimmundimicrobium sp.]
MQTAKKLAHKPVKKQANKELRLITNKRKQSISLGFVVVILTILSVAILFNAVQQTLVTQNAIEIENLQEILSEEQAYNQKLGIEAAQLKSLDRIQEIALGKLGMVVPNKVRYVKISDDNIKNKLAMRNNPHEKFDN